MAEWEVKITVYRNGRRVNFNDALGDSPTEALWNAQNDLELWAQDYESTERKKVNR